MKFFKWFFLGLGFWIILLMLITYPINTRAGAVSSVTLSDKAVTFYSPNGREEIYSLNVPFGKSLNDIQNANIIDNSAFLDYSSDSGSFTNSNNFFFDIGVPSWVGSRAFSFNVLKPGVFVINNHGSGNSILSQFVELNNNTEYFYSFYYNGAFYSGSFLVPFYNSSKGQSLDLYSDSDLLFRIAHNANQSWHIDFYFYSLNFDYEISFLYVGLSDFNYFNSDYLKQLYLNAGYDISNLSWSESPYTSIPFSYDDPIEFNTNLYPTEVTESFSLINSWQSMLTGLDLNYLTFNTFQDLVDTFEDLNNPNNLQIDNVVDVFKSIWFLLKSVFVLLYNVLMLIIAPFVDLFVMLFSFLFSGLDFWILV